MTRNSDKLTDILTEYGVQDDLEIRHVYPLNDISEHAIESSDCPCGPFIDIHDDEIIVIHNPWNRCRRVEYYQQIHGEVSL